MNEITIEDKKYVSSKRAAEMTGYAKDYVGQLCREGRIPARLIGRNWYVLESAIQDHRFGTPEQETEKKTSPVSHTNEHKTPIGWESPKYVSEAVEELPSVNALKEHKAAPAPHFEAPEPILNMEETWKNWFTTKATTVVEEDVVPEPVLMREIEPEREDIAPAAEVEPEEDSVPVHINAIYHHPLPERDVIPTISKESLYEEIEEEVAEIWEKPAKRGYRVTRAISTLVALPLALVVVVLMIVNSGYLDTFVGSYNQASVLTGISTYNK